MKKVITTFCFVAIAFSVQSQTTYQNTTELADSTQAGNSYGNMMEMYGGVLNITGTTDASDGNNYDFLISQSDLLGNPLTEFHAGGTGAEFGRSSYIDASGAKTIGGSSTSFSTSPAGVEDVFVARLPLVGNPIFLTAIGTDSLDYASVVKEANDGNVFLGGRVKNNVGGRTDGLIAKLDSSNGNVIWSESFGTSYANEVIYDVKSLGLGQGYAVAGYSGVNTIGLNEAMFAALDDNGAVQATFLLGGTGDDDARLIMDGPSGKMFLLGNTSSFGAGQGDIFVARFTVGAGLPTMDWFKTYGGTGQDAVTSAVSLSNGGLVVTGITTSFGTGGDGLAFQIDSNGGVIWSKNYGGNGNDAFQNVIKNTAGGYYVLGYTNSTASTKNDLYILELDSNGVSGCQESNCALVSNAAAATFISPPTIPTADFVVTPITLTTRNISGITSGNDNPSFTSICITSVPEKELSPIKVYPNPTSGIVNFELNEKIGKITSVEIYNIMGEKVYATVPTVGAQFFSLDLSFLPEGIYTVVANGNETKQVCRISVIK